MDIAGIGPNWRAYVEITSAPVGVTSSAWISPPYTGTPCSSRTVAGAGTGNRPCAISIAPPPTFRGDDTMSSMPNHSRAKTTPTMSMMESMAPTSWRWTSSRDIPWIAASASARRRNMPMARAFAGADSADDSISAPISRIERCTCVCPLAWGSW